MYFLFSRKELGRKIGHGHAEGFQLIRARKKNRTWSFRASQATPEDLTLPTYLEVGVSRLPSRKIPLSRHSLLCGKHIEFLNNFILGLMFYM